MDIVMMLDELQIKARHNPDIKNQFLNTRQEKEPLTAFCSVCRALGYEIYEMDLICAGEDDFYELFMVSIVS